MNTKKIINKVQIGILIFALVYFFGPDVLVGPLDDAVIVLVSGIVDVVLGVIKATLSSYNTTSFIE